MVGEDFVGGQSVRFEGYPYWRRRFCGEPWGILKAEASLVASKFSSPVLKPDLEQIFYLYTMFFEINKCLVPVLSPH